MIYSVFGTREGLIGHRTASGHIITYDDVFASLPCISALFSWVKIYYAEKQIKCQILDVGPHSIHDDYWNHAPYKPLAESGKSDQPPFVAKNKSGIDLADGIYNALGIKTDYDTFPITWEFTTISTVKT